MTDLTISLLQADLHWEERDANLAMLEEMIWSIESTDIIVLPEMFTTGFSMNPEKLSEPPGGHTFKWMRQMATQKNAAVVGSYIVREKGAYFNRLYFVKPSGQAEQYDKKHLFNLAEEGDHYTAGVERTIVEYKGWRVLPLICYDLRFPVWSRSQRSDDRTYEYDLVLYVANWPDTRVNSWDALLRARAVENLAFSVGVNRIGADGVGKNYNGHSAAYNFLGDTLAFSEGESAVLSCQLSAADLLGYRQEFPFQDDSDSFVIQ